MIDSVHNVDLNFYKELLGEQLTPSILVSTYKDNYGTPSLRIPVRYAKESAFDRAEESRLVYPVISVQNFNPEVDDQMVNVHYRDRISGYRDTDDDGINDTVSAYSEGIPMKCRYEVGLAAKSELEWDAMRRHFMKLYGFKNTSSFIFNKIMVPSDDNLNEDVPIGDGVLYSVSFTDVPRSDGVFETNVIFVLRPWVDIKDPVVYDLVRTINIGFIVKQN